MFDLWEYTFDDSLFCDKVFGWEYRHLLELLDECMCEVLDAGDTVECISEKLESDDGFTGTRPYLEDVTFYEEHSWFPISGRAGELYHDELTDEIFHHVVLATLESQTLCLVLVYFSDTIDTRYRCDDDDIFSG